MRHDLHLGRTFPLSHFLAPHKEPLGPCHVCKRSILLVREARDRERKKWRKREKETDRERRRETERERHKEAYKHVGFQTDCLDMQVFVSEKVMNVKSVSGL